MNSSLQYLVRCFCAQSPVEKLRLMAQVDADDSQLLTELRKFGGDPDTVPSQHTIGFPSRPKLVDPSALPKRSLSTDEGRGAFFHAICHIEFTAINLALDAALRFPNMPENYYRDWLRIAQEEAVHFELLQTHLSRFGYRYGDFEAHDGMWQLAERTSHDVLVRMALVPRVLEARGLDVTPSMIQRLRQTDDPAGVALLTRIYEEEISHVAAGTRWFNFAAKARGIDPEKAFIEIVTQEFGRIRTNKFNQSARVRAGFTENELRQLAAR